MNQENRPTSNAASRTMHDHITLKAWSKPGLIELDFVSGTNNSFVVVDANDGTQNCQS